MSGAEITALAGTAVNTVLLLVIAAFIKDVLERIQIVEKRTYVKANSKNQRLTLLEAFDAQSQREIAKIILQVATLEQSLGQKIYKLRRALLASSLENRRLRKNINEGKTSRKGTSDKLVHATNQIGKIAKILKRQTAKIEALEKIVIKGDYAVYKKRNDGG